jgi:hypothetical protein
VMSEIWWLKCAYMSLASIKLIFFRQTRHLWTWQRTICIVFRPAL